MSITIRAARITDAEQLSNLLRGIGWFSTLQNETAATSQTRITRHLQLCLADDSHNLYIAENEAGLVVGLAAVHWLPYLILAGPEGFVSELFVDESVRGQGVGKQLISAIEEEAIRRGCVRLNLLNGRHRESYARRFYEKLGWQERPDMANFVRYLPNQ